MAQHNSPQELGVLQVPSRGVLQSAAPARSATMHCPDCAVSQGTQGSQRHAAGLRPKAPKRIPCDKMETHDGQLRYSGEYSLPNHRPWIRVRHTRSTWQKITRPFLPSYEKSSSGRFAAPETAGI